MEMNDASLQNLDDSVLSSSFGKDYLGAPRFPNPALHFKGGSGPLQSTVRSWLIWVVGVGEELLGRRLGFTSLFEFIPMYFIF
jgi:hypothetical protein